MTSVSKRLAPPAVILLSEGAHSCEQVCGLCLIVCPGRVSRGRRRVGCGGGCGPLQRREQLCCLFLRQRDGAGGIDRSVRCRDFVRVRCSRALRLRPEQGNHFWRSPIHQKAAQAGAAQLNEWLDVEIIGGRQQRQELGART
jgi:hypothetical protein